MLHKLLILLLPLLLVAQEYSIIRIENVSGETISTLYEAGYDIASSRVDGYIELVVSPDQAQQLALHYDYKVVLSAKEISRNHEIFQATCRSRSAVGRSYDEPVYLTYDEYVAELEALEQKYAAIMKVENIGPSMGKLQGSAGYEHDIWAIKVSDNVNEYEAEPEFLFCGETHAREIQTFPITFAILKEMLELYESDPKIKAYVDNNQLYFVPLLNPDGYMLARYGTNPMWRKNCNKNGQSSLGTWSGSRCGVDLNRQYTYKWGLGASGSLTSDTYMGTAAESEAEVQAIMKYIRAKNINGGISYHSHGEMVLTPWSHQSNANPPIDHPEMLALGKKMAAHLPKEEHWSNPDGGNYDVGSAIDLLGYGAGGAMTENMYFEFGSFFFCYEVWNSFQTGEKSLPELCGNMRKAAHEMLDRATYSVLRGTITIDDKPGRGKIVVKGLDDSPQKERNDVYSNSETGYYVRFLAPGDYSVTFTADEGPYAPITKSVTITESGATYEDINFGETDVISHGAGAETVSNFSVKALDNRLAFTVPAAGSYLFRVTTASGRVLLQRDVEARSSHDRLTLPLNNAFGQQIIFAELISGTERLVQQVSLQ